MITGFQITSPDIGGAGGNANDGVRVVLFRDSTPLVIFDGTKQTPEELIAAVNSRVRIKALIEKWENEVRTHFVHSPPKQVTDRRIRELREAMKP